MHLYSRDQQAFHITRTEGERWFSRLNTLVIGMNIVCFFTAFIRLSSTNADTMRNSFFTVSDLQLAPIYYIPNCTYAVTETRSVFIEVTYNITPDNIEYFVSRNVLQVRFLLAVAGVLAAVSLANRCCFEFNIHELRYNFVVFQKDVLTVLEILLLCLGGVTVTSVNPMNRHIYNYLLQCNQGILFKTYNFVIPLVELQISIFSSMIILGINIIAALFTRLGKPNPMEELIRRDRQLGALAAQQQLGIEEKGSESRSGGTESVGRISSSSTQRTTHTPYPDGSSVRSGGLLPGGNGTTTGFSPQEMNYASGSPGAFTATSSLRRFSPCTPASALAALEVEEDDDEDAENQLLACVAGRAQGPPSYAPSNSRIISPAIEASTPRAGDQEQSRRENDPSPVGSPVRSSAGHFRPSSSAMYYRGRLKAQGEYRNTETDAATEDTVRM